MIVVIGSVSYIRSRPIRTKDKNVATENIILSLLALIVIVTLVYYDYDSKNKIVCFLLKFRFYLPL